VTIRILVAMAITLLVGQPSASARQPEGCTSAMSAGTTTGGLTARAANSCNGIANHRADPDDPHAPAVRFIDCGSSESVANHPSTMGYSPCATAHLLCDGEVARRAAMKSLHDIVEIDTSPGGQQTVTNHCHVATRRSSATVTADMARDEAEKLLPHPKIGVAPPGGVTLVNIETVLWVDTRADRLLGTVRLLGHRVDLRAHVERVSWDFGDGSTGTSTTPGKAYTSADPCKTVDCPDYFGHTYVHTGEVSITAQLTWTGEFRVDGAAWQPITGTVSAPATATGVHVKEARGILVPNP
jgi:hypothetical protein